MLTLRIEGELEPGIRETIAAGLAAFNRPFIGERRIQPLNITVRRDDGGVAGGLIGELRWQWFYIDTLWLAEDARGRHLGQQVMQLAEEEARRLGCIGAFVDTLDFQARGFYERLGFTVYGTQPDYPPGHVRYYLLKRYD